MKTLKPSGFDVCGRKFLKKAGLGMAGLGFFFRPIAGNSRQLNSPAKKSGIGHRTITCDGFGDENFEKAFEIIPQLPFKKMWSSTAGMAETYPIRYPQHTETLRSAWLDTHLRTGQFPLGQKGNIVKGCRP